MQGDENNLKDTKETTEISMSLKDAGISYTKTNKLITALYMVTDIMDIAEPMRLKLRGLGSEIISDTNTLEFSNNSNLAYKILKDIRATLSFLEIAVSLNMISVMNVSILKKEFGELNKAIENLYGSPKILTGEPTLSDFFAQDTKEEIERLPAKGRMEVLAVGHNFRPVPQGSSIGVQKGSTLMKALTDKIITDKKVAPHPHKNEFEILKNERRAEIIAIVKNKKIDSLSNGQQDGCTISDIKNEAQSKPNGSLKTCSEKTLQRELVSMVEDGVLYKTGEKRWSKYFLK